MEALRIENLNFCYPSGHAALSGISLSVSRGDVAVVCGPSGSGKTTLLRLLKPTLAPSGRMTGQIVFNGRPLSELTEEALCREIAFVSQDPENQLVTDMVWHELAFGLERLGTPPEEIRLRVAETAAFFGLEYIFRSQVKNLSGGQKQLVCLAAAMTLRPALLILDEPTSQLDPLSAGELFQVLRRVNAELGVTIVISEHRTEELLPISSRLIVMDRGRVTAQGEPRQVCRDLEIGNSPMFAAMPTASRVWAGAGGRGICPFTVAEGGSWLETALLNPLPPPKNRERSRGGTALSMKDLWFRYSRNGQDVLRGLDLTVRQGELFALVGGNGSGKSTLLTLAAGLFRPYRGRVQAAGRTALLPQDPHMLFLRPTLREDLLSVLPTEEGGLPGELVSFWGLEGLLDRHPYDLSGGELQRAAMAKLMLTKPDILLLDEPTKGLDAVFKRRFAALLEGLCREGKTVVLVSHDLEFCALCVHRCCMLFDGQAMGTAEPKKFFSDNRFYTTAAVRMAKGLVPGAITDEDLILACGGTPPHEPPQSTPPHGPLSLEGEGGKPGTVPPSRRPSGRAMALSGAFLSLAALTALFGPGLFGERRYYFTALLMLLWCGLALIPVFESRRPGARELVFIAVLCALAVAGRAVFYMLPQCKPTLALIIISGAALGARGGFAVGAMTAFISNFFFGQGPWTPWQMLAMGLMGLLSGLLFSRRKEPSLPLLCLFGALSCVLIYGGIVNAASLLLTQAEPNWQAVVTVYALGLPFDLVQAGATAVFLLLLARPLLEKLARAKLKFGLSAPI